MRWTTKSTSHLADELTEAGHEVSSVTVGRLLKRMGYSLQGNAKTVEGKQHPDRDARFRYINEQVAVFQGDWRPGDLGRCEEEGVGRHRCRYRCVRGGVDPPLVANRWAAGVSAGHPGY